MTCVSSSGRAQLGVQCRLLPSSSARSQRGPAQAASARRSYSSRSPQGPPSCWPLPGSRLGSGFWTGHRSHRA